MLLLRHHEPALLDDHCLRFLVWYLFGNIVLCWRRDGARTPDVLNAGDLESGRYLVLAHLAARIAEVTGLDWFVTEMVGLRARPRLQVVVVEPANASAGLGPGRRPLRHVPPQVLTIAAERIVGVACRRARGLPSPTGTTIRVTS